MTARMLLRVGVVIGLLVSSLLLWSGASTASAGGREGHECNKQGDSLVVKGMSCKAAKRLVSDLRDYAYAAYLDELYKFDFVQGFTCRLPYEDTYKIVCVDKKPKKRSFTLESD